ncbi:unnamed protein product [Caenorhabditis bovis]|uniref:LIM zinc-binding domain-containing protein n=1 Tax=Caenorhabditis bovis TaxID=2654633 RepID=A0A8S1FFK7_9PELO|nr:unnamed protein product [Caenorhabditis bovis]
MSAFLCGGCAKPIANEDISKKKVVWLLNRLWHFEHLKCIFCKANLKANRVFQSNVDRFEPCCFDCHMQTRHPACAECCEPLFESGYRAVGRYFHRKCFKCVACSKPVAKGGRCIFCHFSTL